MILIILESWIFLMKLSLESLSWFLNCSWLNLEIILLGFFSSSLLSSRHLESILIHHHEAMKFASTFLNFVLYKNDSNYIMSILFCSITHLRFWWLQRYILFCSITCLEFCFAQSPALDFDDYKGINCW